MMTKMRAAVAAVVLLGTVTVCEANLTGIDKGIAKVKGMIAALDREHPADTQLDRYGDGLKKDNEALRARLAAELGTLEVNRALLVRGNLPYTHELAADGRLIVREREFNALAERRRKAIDDRNFHHAARFHRDKLWGAGGYMAKVETLRKEYVRLRHFNPFTAQDPRVVRADAAGWDKLGEYSTVWYLRKLSEGPRSYSAEVMREGAWQMRNADRLYPLVDRLWPIFFGAPPAAAAAPAPAPVPSGSVNGGGGLLGVGLQVASTAARVASKVESSANKGTPAAPASAPAPVTVSRGDTLGEIATDLWRRLPSDLRAKVAVWGPGGLVEQIARHNGIANPNLIHAGDRIAIPKLRG